MSILHPLLAQDIIPTDVLPGASWHWMGLTLKELMMVLGAVAAVTLPVVLWAVYIRKRPHSHSRRHHRHHHHHQDVSPTLDRSLRPEAEAEAEADADAEGDRRHRRKRRRRREHRPRNPTLAETGGLPPLRSERPSDPLP